MTKRRVRLLLLLVALSGMCVGYWYWLVREITWMWREEVELSDGSHVWVTRRERRGPISGGEPFRGPSQGTKLSQVEIQEGPVRVAWSERMEPMLVQRGPVPGSWVVVAAPIWCDEYRKYGSPSPPYVEFVYVDGVWRYRAVSSRWYGARSNLLMPEDERATRDGGSVTATEVRDLNSPVNNVFPHLLTVRPEALFDCSRQ